MRKHKQNTIIVGEGLWDQLGCQLNGDLWYRLGNHLSGNMLNHLMYQLKFSKRDRYEKA